MVKGYIGAALSIKDLHLPARAINALSNSDIKTLGDLLNADDKTLLAIPNLGKKSIALIDENLANIDKHRYNKRYISRTKRKLPNWRQLYLGIKYELETHLDDVHELKAWIQLERDLRAKDQDNYAEEIGKLIRYIDELEAKLEEYKNDTRI